MYNVATKQLGFRARSFRLASPSSHWQILRCGLNHPSLSPAWTTRPAAGLAIRHEETALEGQAPNSKQSLYGSLMPSAQSTTRSADGAPPRELEPEPIIEDVDGIIDASGNRKSSLRRLSNTRPAWTTDLSAIDAAFESTTAAAANESAAEDAEGGKSKELWHAYRRYISTLSTEGVMEELRVKASRPAGEINNVRLLCKYLIKERDVRPNLEMFSALICMNVHERRGSARSVKRTLTEMAEWNIELDVKACHDILRVMAVHPDYLMILDVLEYMQTRWFDLNDDGQRNVILGFLRSAQYELALERLDTMLEQGADVQPWLFDVVIYNLCLVHELDEVLRLLQIRSQHDELAISLTMWAIILDTASAQLHYETLAYVWARRVRPGYLHPQDGVCLNIMVAAARAGDIDLATEVFSLLSERDTVLQHHHYEVLLEAYLSAHDVEGALSLLCIMQEARLEPDTSSTRVLLGYLLKSSASARIEALKTLREVRNDDSRHVPLIVVNTLIEAHILSNEVAEAVEVYKTLHTLVSGGPNAATFDILLSGCASTAHKELALSLASEMPILKVAPTGETYRQIIAVCLSDRESDGRDALDYYHEATAHGINLNVATLKALTRRLLSGSRDLVAAGLGIVRESAEMLINDKEFEGLVANAANEH